MPTPPAMLFTSADSARAMSDVYSVSLVATLPVLAALVACICLRESNAGTRAIVWRCALAGVLSIYAGRYLHWQWMAWLLPEPLAMLLVTFGMIHLDIL